jgi:hypothetical protein
MSESDEGPAVGALRVQARRRQDSRAERKAGIAGSGVAPCGSLGDPEVDGAAQTW